MLGDAETESTTGAVPSTVTSWVAGGETLPYRSVTCADTAAVPFGSCATSEAGIVALQPVPAAFTVAA